MKLQIYSLGILGCFLSLSDSQAQFNFPQTPPLNPFTNQYYQNQNRYNPFMNRIEHSPRIEERERNFRREERHEFNQVLGRCNPRERIYNPNYNQLRGIGGTTIINPILQTPLPIVNNYNPLLPQVNPVITQYNPLTNAPINPLISPPVGNLSPIAQQVLALYEQYLGRNPGINGITNWIAVAQTQGIQSVQAGILASPEYFQLQGSNSITWINSIYSQLLNRTPTILEQNNMVRLYNNSNGNRTGIVLNLLNAINQGLR